MSEFVFDFRWMEHLKLRDYEDFERETGRPWTDVFHGSVVTENGKVLYDNEGNVLRQHRTDVQVALVWVIKRINDPSITINQIRDLPTTMLGEIRQKFSDYIDEITDTVKKEVAARTAEESPGRKASKK